MPSPAQAHRPCTEDAEHPAVQHDSRQPPVSPSTRRIPSLELFAGAQEIEIQHQEQVYRLRQTALGKLILTK